MSIGMRSPCVRWQAPAGVIEALGSPAVATSSMTEVRRMAGLMKTMKMSYANMRHSKIEATLSEGSRSVVRKRMQTQA